MSSLPLNTEQMEALTNVMKNTMIEILPDIIKQVTPVMSVIIKELTPLIMKSTANAYEKTRTNVEEVEETQRRHETQFKTFKAKNKKDFDNKLEERKEYFSKFRGHDMHLEIYGQCLAKEPVHIPKKFRTDDYYVNDEEELTSVKKFELQRFRSEVEILTKRRNFTLQKMAEIDENVISTIKKANLPIEVEIMACERWHVCVDNDTKRYDEISLGKRNSTIEAMKKDEDNYKKL